MAAITQADHIFKTKYAPKLTKMLGETDKLQKMFPFVGKSGSEFKESIDIEYDHGFTFAGNDQAPTLRAAISGEGVQTTFTPSQIIGRKQVGYRDLYRSAGAGDEKAAHAFVDLNKKKYIDLTLGHRRNIEISLLHGQSAKGIGVVSGLASQVITVNFDSWAPGVWMGARGMVIDVFQSDGTTIRQADLVVDEVDEENRTITVTGTTTGIVAGDIIKRDTAYVAGAKDCLGIMKMLQTVTGTLLGVNVAQHPLFKPNVYNFNTTKPTLKGFLNAAAKTVIKGYSGDLVALIPVALFEVLNESISALREYDTSYKPQQALNGVEAIQYRYQGGKIFLVPHLMMMQGDIAFLPLEENVDVEDRAIVRRGSVDLSFELPDEDGKIFLQVADTAAKEIRSYSDQGLSYRKPGWCAHGKNASY